jgi:hypothetical protein
MQVHVVAFLSVMQGHVVAFLPRVRPEIAPRASGKGVETSGKANVMPNARAEFYSSLKSVSEA